MKPSEAYSAGIYAHLYGWMDAEQIARNREKWRASVERLGDKWLFLQEQQRIQQDAKVRDLPRKAAK